MGEFYSRSFCLQFRKTWKCSTNRLIKPCYGDVMLYTISWNLFWCYHFWHYSRESLIHCRQSPHTHTHSWISQETKTTAEKELYSKELRSRFSLFFTWNIHMKPFIRFPATFLNPTSSFSEWIPEKERFPCVFIIFQNSPTQIIGTQPQKTTPQRCGQTNGALFGVSETAAN